MKPGYFHNCTFFALLKDRNGLTYWRLEFIPEPASDPKHFFNWCKRKVMEVEGEAGEKVALVDCKIMEPVEQTYLEFSNQ